MPFETVEVEIYGKFLILRDIEAQKTFLFIDDEILVNFLSLLEIINFL